ncbi:MAG: TRAP transporter substrate-binding protein [Burkholderiales bacterium]|jgi:TRAP-type mannitol/chloroaromatic compound transport system substrate-binding protein|nr:TRAP transporter substrate-binding protein [Burkholderiales bacterium]MCA3224878.1 TRAP transporter substrate-binding protein [Burkholderiales bacterium]MCE2646839.1 TRAP transporter substrate-binding protein [Burkholderiaceae bacterium]
MKRRNFVAGTGAAGAALASALIAAPGIARAQQNFRWRMTTTWPAGLPFYQVGPGSAAAFAERVDKMSNGRIKIQVFAAGELLPAFEGFDAVSNGTIELNHGVSYFWSGKTFAAQYFATVPFGMSFLGHYAWLQFGGGNALWEETYRPLNVVPFAAGCSGVQMTGWFKKEIRSLADLKGVKMRIPGLAGRIYSALGVEVRQLPGGEIFPALERGVIDAAEFVGPFLDARLGLQNAAKNYYASGWHEPSTVSEIVIQRKIWEALPADLKDIVRAAADATNQEGLFLLEARNADALDTLVSRDKVNVRSLPTDVVKALRATTADVLNEAAKKDPQTRKVHESFFAFKRKHDKWSEISEESFLVNART